MGDADGQSQGDGTGQDASAGGLELSGPQWVARFPTSTELATLTDSFRACCVNFLDALRAAGATVTISATRRPIERAYLMRNAFLIARGTPRLDPAAVSPMPGVAINWVHPDPADSVAAAEAMVKGFDIAFLPSMSSRHFSGRAIDMTITWEGALGIAAADGSTVQIDSGPTTGQNPLLWTVGLGYGVHKLVSDPPHWSDDGH